MTLGTQAAETSGESEAARRDPLKGKERTVFPVHVF